MPTDDAVLTGFHSRQGDREFIALDYDYLTHDQVVADCQTLINQYQLPPFYVVESTPASYHALCFKLMDPEQADKIYAASQSDPGHKNVRDERGNATIRISKKRHWNHPPKLLDVIKSPWGWKEDTALKTMYLKLLSLEQDDTVTLVEWT